MLRDKLEVYNISNIKINISLDNKIVIINGVFLRVVLDFDFISLQGRCILKSIALIPISVSSTF